MLVSGSIGLETECRQNAVARCQAQCDPCEMKISFNYANHLCQKAAGACHERSEGWHSRRACVSCSVCLSNDIAC